MRENSLPHKSIFLEEFLQFFASANPKSFIDATLGAGGHSEAILTSHPQINSWIGIDQDKSALELAQKRLQMLLQGKRAQFVHLGFAQAAQMLAQQGDTYDGIFMDIGVSSMQLDQAHRGFSFRFDGPLDMRMDQESELDAAFIVNKWDSKKLEQIFREFGEEPHAKKAADMISLARKKKKLQTTHDLVEALKGLWPHGRKHPATRVFQALRIAVNRELEQLEQSLPLFMNLLAPGGKLGVITFHSLEDRIVKNCFRDRAKSEAGWMILTPKPIEPSFKEQKANPRSRSAKLRFIEKLSFN